MNSNNPNLNRKQEELVKRLEEIRRKRNVQDTDTQANDSLEGRSLEQQSEPRNRNKQKRTTTKPKRRSSTKSRRNEPQKRNKQTEYTEQIPRQTEGVSLESTSVGNRYSSRPNRNQLSNKRANAQNKFKKQNGSNLIEQLSDGNKLADAIILSEILSKPVALKKRYR